MNTADLIKQLPLQLRKVALLIFVGCCLAAPAQAQNKGMLSGVHGDQRLLPATCRTCHRGMNMSIRGEESLCLSCHGNSAERQRMVSSGYLGNLGGERLANIEAELRKPYNHPVLTVSNIHRRDEQLPESQLNAYRHAECVDCHEVHVLTKDKPYKGLQGRRVGNFLGDIEHEYELCYRCHSSSANLPADATDKQQEFRLANRSYHPVEGEGANAHVISLKEPYSARKENPGDITIISCSDCHGSDEDGGPRGPHGSAYRGLLVENYEMEDGRPESQHAYALCYKCHERNSILGNESFPLHAQHILGDRARNLPGTSCFTCHDAHGSVSTQYLIRFNDDVVEPLESGILEFKAQGVASRHGSCTLICHGVVHDRQEY